ncbi:MAG: hypothetical protein AAF610_15330, partial [Pseudomonadota bacterium]
MTYSRADRLSSLIERDMGQRVRGLVELVFVFAAIAVLTAMAARAQSKMVARAQASEIGAVTSGLKLALSMEYALTGRWITSVDAEHADDVTGLGWPYTGQYVERIEVMSDGQLDAWFAGDTAPPLRDRHVSYQLNSRDPAR